MSLLLVADVGGTKSELAVFRFKDSANTPLLQQKYTNADFSGIEEIIELFLKELGELPQFACFAVAGVVSGDRVRMTNLSWALDCRLLEQRFGFQRVVVINDLTALCYSLDLLGPSDLQHIYGGSGQGGEVSGVIAPGTGLGEGFRVALGGRMFASGTEGGHTDFAPVGKEQRALLAWMQKKMQPVSYEALISGPGLANLYDFYKEYHRFPESPLIAKAMQSTKDRVPVIIAGVTAAIGETPCPLCSRVIDLFLSILGSEAGNLALKLYAMGGIYLGGGILPRLVGWVNFDIFLHAFQAKGMMSDLMREIPVFLIVKKDAPLIGAVSCGRQLLPKGKAF